MANVAQSRVIGSATYEVGLLPWGKSIALWARIMSTLGPTIGAMTAGGLTSLKGLLGSDIGPAITRLSQDLGADDFEFIVGTLLEAQTIRRIEGDKRPRLDRQQWDIVFTGKVFESMKVIVFALEVNYGDFLGGIRAALEGDSAGQDEAPEPSSSESPQALTGTNGG